MYNRLEVKASNSQNIVINLLNRIAINKFNEFVLTASRSTGVPRKKWRLNSKLPILKDYPILRVDVYGLVASDFFFHFQKELRA
jgi:hypothetical protein